MARIDLQPFSITKNLLSMAAPFLSELRIFSFANIPPGWMPCNGQILPVNTNRALYSLLGKTYGGDGVNTFGLPNLNASVPIHRGGDYKAGDMGGEEEHQLTIAEIPNHTHQAIASSNRPDSDTPDNNFWALNPDFTPYGKANDSIPMSARAVETVGSDMPHNNMAPFLTLNICIAVEGIYPNPNFKDDVSDQWIGEIRILAGSNLPPKWFWCDGQLISLTTYTQLFSLIGITYGGGGSTTFALPDIKGRAPLMFGQGKDLSLYKIGDKGGETTVTLTENEMPVHTHAAFANQVGTAGEPGNLIWANPASIRPAPNFYASAKGDSPLSFNPNAISPVGGNGAHNNLMPYSVLNFCIASDGTYPPIE